MHLIMLRHNLLITFRSFTRNKSTLAINLIGLSSGLTCVLLIVMWIGDEWRMDKFHEKEGRLYQVMQNFQRPTGIHTWEATPGPLASELASELPEVELAVNANFSQIRPEGVMGYGESYLEVGGIFASEGFFDVFSFDLLQGNPRQVLAGKNNIVLSEDLASRLFQSSGNAVGKSLEWSYLVNGQNVTASFQISGIFKDPPASSSVDFDAVIHYEQLIQINEYAGEWSNDYTETFVVLNENVNLQAFNDKITSFLASKNAEREPSTLFVQRFSDQYLHGRYENGGPTGGRIGYVRLFSIIALLTLIIACINFVNLSTAQASKKMKEVGVKKAIGASRKTLVIQFLSESMLIVFLALFLAIAFASMLLPEFNTLTGKQLAIKADPHLFSILFAVLLLTGLMAGGYPAFYLSGIQPISVLKGRLTTSIKEFWVRKGLVIFQFTLSVVFIIGVAVMHQQMKYVGSKNLGYTRNNVLHFSLGSNQVDPGIFLSELRQIPGVTNASNISSDFLTGNVRSGGYSWSGEESDKKFPFKAPRVGYDFIETLGMEMVAGRPFSSDFKDDASKIVVNESAVAMMGIDNPVGKFIDYGTEKRQIVGVVKDFHYGTIHRKIEPLIFRYRYWGRNILVRLGAGAESAAIDQIEQLYQKFHPQDSFAFTFLDESYQSLYTAESRVAVISRFFCLLAIIISCLGLFGMAAFSTALRSKEIGIRKVFGSSRWDAVCLLSYDFLKTVGIGVVIALPISYLAITRWLNNFHYHIGVQWWLFAGVAGMVMVLAWIAVSYHVLKAASVNPVRSLHWE